MANYTPETKRQPQDTYDDEKSELPGDCTGEKDVAVSHNTSRSAARMNIGVEQQQSIPPSKETAPEAELSDEESTSSQRSSSAASPPADEHNAKTEHASGHEEQPRDSLDEAPSLEEARSRAQSRASSVRSRAPTIVARSKRRGLFGQLTLLPEVSNPYEYERQRKWIITAVVALAGAASPLGSSIFYPALPEMAQEFNASPTVTNLTIAVYMLAMAIFPLWWSSFSETLGRRTIYLVSFALFTVFSIVSALSTSIGMLIVMRVLGGGASASVQAVGAGTIADIWEVRERGGAMGMFYLGPLLGPLLAPIFGGILTARWGWQSTMWFLTIFGGVLFVLILFCLPETLAKRRPVLAPVPTPSATTTNGADRTTSRLSRMSSATQSVTTHTKRTATFLHRCLIEPLSVLANLRHPPIALTVYWAAITFGSLFALNISIQSVFSAPPYNFPPLTLGLLYLPSSLGYIVASIVGGRWMDRIMIREARRAGRFDERGKPIYLPEDRMRENAWLAASLFPGALVWYAWTAEARVHWAVPAVANFFFGVGSMIVFGMAVTMLTEFMPQRSSGGVAINNFVRNIFSCTFAVVTQPLLDALGSGWLFTILGLVSFVSGNAIIWVLRRKGPQWRENAKGRLTGA